MRIGHPLTDTFRVLEVFEVLGLEFRFRVFLSLELEPELDLPLSLGHSFLTWGVSHATSECCSQ